MSGPREEVKYAVDFRTGRRGRREDKTPFSIPPAGEAAGSAIPRIARLMALAIRFESLLRGKRVRDYAELARLGGVTRARMTQIMKLLDLAPDIQEQILFLPPLRGINERTLRPVVSGIDWAGQRLIFSQIMDRLDRAGESA